MDDRRINILGASGSGASTVGRELSAILGVPHFDSDDYYHVRADPPFQIQRSPRQRCALLTADVRQSSSWVLSGGVAGWEPYPQLQFTLVVFLWVPTAVRLERLRCREYERFGERIRPGGDMYATHEDFIAWAARYDIGDVEGKTLKRHEAYLAEQTCPVLEYREALAPSQITAAIVQSFGVG